MERREFLRLLGAAGVTAALPWATTGCAGLGGERRRSAVYYVPGNALPDLYYKGMPILRSPELTRDLPKLHRGRFTLLTRLDEKDRSIRRTILPLGGHDVTVRGDGATAVCNARDGGNMVSFDPVSLALDVHLQYDADRRGGGHSVYLPDGQTMAVVERRPYAYYAGDPVAHYGRLAIRDSKTLELIEDYSSGGVTPHDIELLHDGKHVAVSNYGSTTWPRGQAGYNLYVVEPSVAVIELASGKTVHKYVPTEPASEYRHLAAHSIDRIFVLQNTSTSLQEYQAMMSENDRIYSPVLATTKHTGDASLPVVRVDFSSDAPPKLLTTADPRAMIRGQSITYDPVHDEVLATFPGSGSVVAFSGSDGSVRHVTHTGELGLSVPRGIALHPDGRHYAVGGNMANVFVFERGSHEMAGDLSFYTPVYKHSHLTAA